MHFSWKDIWLCRLALVLLIPLAVGVVMLTATAPTTLAGFASFMYELFGYPVAFASCLAVVLGCYVGLIVFMALLREKLRRQHEARNVIEPLFWHTSRAMAMTRTKTMEFVRDSGALVTIRLEAGDFVITEFGRDAVSNELKLTRNSLVNVMAIGTEVTLDYAERLRGDINVHANQLRIAFA